MAVLDPSSIAMFHFLGEFRLLWQGLDSKVYKSSFGIVFVMGAGCDGFEAYRWRMRELR
jgi:hypothetical protein